MTLTKWLKWFLGFISCHALSDHDWTCAAARGIKPSETQLRGGIIGFWDYATMYCARCGTMSHLSRRH